jgi:hypothetical protein
MNATLHREGDQLIVQHDADPRFSYEVSDCGEAQKVVEDTVQSFNRIFGGTINIKVENTE